MRRAGERWEVFARHEASQPIRHVGTVEAATPDDAEVFATTVYEEFKWIDMFIAPRRSIVTVVDPRQ